MNLYNASELTNLIFSNKLEKVNIYLYKFCIFCINMDHKYTEKTFLLKIAKILAEYR